MGNAAKKLGLDYLEVPFPESENQPWLTTKSQKRYAETDIRAIFEQLRELATLRARFQ
ncbi:hypothetical protein [Ferrovum myxofaciens]|uniref:Uncharacterized protein n=1 Tax=Ferrovum myxofaciens TaxID=416213 RepID=A0A9E6MXN4_9PROT|nr:hypothetical protein [Ferrovum myxofaciens]QKE37311.1 MAG: hypothetical protein HO273_00040 [Ferrovum myxofaciens]QWY74956.1 MAG: hypothetical protein JVY19_00490 [Ferrovum myxofaciens]QWY77704.1 MAG: hypothetical protein JZL65_01045 [Ferrovum myxofaciens]